MTPSPRTADAEDHAAPRLRLGFTRNAVHVVVRDEVVVPVPTSDIFEEETTSDHYAVHVYLRVAL